MVQYKHKVITLVAAIAVIMGLVGCQAQASAQKAPVQTATVKRGSLTALVNTSGAVTASAQVTLNFKTTGQVKEIDAQTGQQVKAGQTLAKLDTTDLDLAVKLAQVNLDSAKTKLAQTQAGPKPADMASAQAAVGSAAAAYQAALQKYNLSNDQLTVARAQVDKAAAALQRAQAAYDWHAHDWLDPVPTNSQQYTDLQNAQSALQLAQASYNQTAAGINNSEVQSAASQLAQAQYTLDNLKNTPTAQDLAIGQAQVQQAQAQLDQAKIQQSNAVLTAPFDGTVADINIQPGQAADASTQAVILTNLSQLDVAVTLAETDLPNVKVGQAAQVQLDAVPGQTFDGRVAEIDVVGTTTQGVVNYPVTVVISNTKDAAIRPGMNASVGIVLAQHDNALLVPNRAVQTVGRQHVVTVLYQGQQIQVPVQIGLSSDTQTEILSGLQEGDVVLIGSSTTTTTSGGGPGGPGGLGGFGR